MTALTILWNTFAVIGLLSVVGSLGWFVFTWRTTASGQHDPTPDEVVAAHTGNVRVLREVNAAPTLPVAPVSDGFMRGVVDGDAS